MGEFIPKQAPLQEVYHTFIMARVRAYASIKGASDGQKSEFIVEI